MVSCIMLIFTGAVVKNTYCLFKGPGFIQFVAHTSEGLEPFVTPASEESDVLKGTCSPLHTITCRHRHLHITKTNKKINSKFFF